MSSEEVSVWISMKPSDLEFLLALSGVTKWYGLRSETLHSTDKSEHQLSENLAENLQETPGAECETQEESMTPGGINRRIADMYRNGLLTYENDGLAVTGRYRQVVEVIKNTCAVVTASVDSLYRDSVISYVSEDAALIAESDRMSRGRLRMKMLDRDELPNYLLQEYLTEKLGSSGKVVIRKIDPVSGDTIEQLAISEHGLSRTAEHEIEGQDIGKTVSPKTSSLRTIIRSWIEC